jgi:uncharacterized protein YukE
MAKTLKLAANLSLPLNAVTEKIAWLGRTGSGKSYGAMKMAELMLAAGAQIGAIDPVGVWRSLRVPATKGGASYDVVVFGGLYGDLPLTPQSGVLVADLICDRGISFVLDVSQFIPSEQQKFVKDFADLFFHRKKSAPSAVHLFMEECQEFIPENPSGAEALTLGVMQRLWKLGRNFGIGGSLISQRPQEIAKKALNMSGTLFAFQMTGPQERKAIRAWVADHGVSVDIESVLQKLEVGQPHVESPTFLKLSQTVRILPRVTADLSSTPEVGASTAAKRALTPIDVEQLQTAMAETVERARADDPKELRKQLAEKDREIRALSDSRNTSIQPAGKDVPVLTDADRRLLEKIAGAYREYSTDAADDPLMAALNAAVTKQLEQLTAAWFRDLQRRFAGVVQEFNRPALARIIEKLDRVASPDNLTKQGGKSGLLNTARGPQNATQEFHKTLSISSDSKNNPSKTGGSGRSLDSAPKVGQPGPRLQPAQQRILNALAWLNSIRIQGWTREVVAFVAGASSRSSAFSNNASALRTGGYLEYPQQNHLALTEAGTSQAEPPEAPITPADLHAQIRALLQPAQWRIVEAAIKAYPKALTRADLAAAAGASDASSAFSNNVSRVRTLGLIDYPSQGMVVGTPLLFLQGR